MERTDQGGKETGHFVSVWSISSCANIEGHPRTSLRAAQTSDLRRPLTLRAWPKKGDDGNDARSELKFACAVPCSPHLSWRTRYARNAWRRVSLVEYWVGTCKGEVRALVF